MTRLKSTAVFAVEEFAKGRTQASIAAELGISKSNVSRLVKAGSIDAGIIVKTREKSRPLWDRLALRMTPTDQGCTEWNGAVRNSGYGQFTYKGKNRLVHRIVYECVYGPVPDGLVIDHVCRNKLCVNPDHLRAVTQSENVLSGQRWNRCGAK